MVLTDYAKLKILSLWRHGDGPTLIVKKLQADGIITTRKTVSSLISRYAVVVHTDSSLVPRLSHIQKKNVIELKS